MQFISWYRIILVINTNI